MTWLALLACTGATTSEDSGTDTGAAPWTETLAPDSFHLLVGGTPGEGNEQPALVELDLTFTPRWALAFDDGSGTAGALRRPDGTTAYARTWPPPELGSALEVVDADGVVLSSREDVFPSLSFVHGLEEAPDGTWIVADTTAGQVFGMEPGGERLWSLSFTDEDDVWLPNGIAVGTDAADTTWLAVTLLHSAGPSGDRVEAYRLDADGPTFAWSWEPEDAEGAWPHGPAVLADGTVTVALSARGQVVGLRDGQSTWRIPEAPGAVSFPRDAVFLPDGTLLLADGATELVRVADPFGDFEVVEAVAAPGIYCVEVVDCAEGGCL